MSAALAWLILILGITCYVAGYDVWAAFTHHTLMTTQFRDWLFNPVTGPFVFGGWSGAFIGLTFHWFLRHAPQK